MDTTQAIVLPLLILTLTCAVETQNEKQKLEEDHSDIEHEEAAIFMKKIFQKYGKNGVMTYEGFEHLLSSLGVGNVNIEDHDIHDHYVKGTFENIHFNHNHTVADENDVEKSENETSDELSHNHRHHKRQKQKRSATAHSKGTEEDSECMTPAEILTTFHLRNHQTITKDNFLHLCPAIVYQIDKHSCFNQRCDDIHTSIKIHLKSYHTDNDHSHINGSVNSEKMQFWNIPAKTWGFAVLAVTIISLVGLVCVAIIPIMQKLFFNHLIQFLVALAIGSLTGDALLHLIPHAIVPHTEASHDHDAEKGSDNHSTAVYQGLAVLAGLYIFFLAERGLAFLAEWKNKKSLKKKIADIESGEPLVENKRYSVVGENIGEKLSRYNRLSVYDSSVQSGTASTSLHTNDEELQELKIYDEHAVQNKLHALEEEGDQTGKDIQGHENHHGHGHSHTAPGGSVSSIAWMVIMGDGLHNFCDGLAIGASFASSITGGLSTSVAVFCHELPHELGDFAVLLKTGMSAKQAVFYNLVSSVLCFMGVVIGLLAGNLDNADSWIFSMAGGMFIYISLVDMLPEITNKSSADGHKWCYLLLHCLGISTGISIMLVIALYEDRISLGLGDDAL